MLRIALSVALAYWITFNFSDYTGIATDRPIILGFVTGLILGDVKTGIIMGAQLEAIYMGVSPIGGTVSSNYTVATVITTGLVIASGIDLEAGLALAVPIGAATTAVTPFRNTLKNIVYPMYKSAAEKGQYRKFWNLRHLTTLGFNRLLETIVIFACILFGTDFTTNIVNMMPEFVMRGLTAATGMLVVIGLALITQCLWSKTCGFYVLLGFVAAKFLGLSTIVVAIVGVIIAALSFFRSNEINELKLSMVQSDQNTTEGDDDFYA
jgi:mannose/fructose/N-acetylgalactosamine-specific phosphotransferase system component IIC